jgi:hypothetical protein
VNDTKAKIVGVGGRRVGPIFDEIFKESRFKIVF